jgi:L-fucose isomerase-like protein
MTNFRALYIPVGVPTFHKESIFEQFDLSVSLLRKISMDIETPEQPLLTLDDLVKYISCKSCDLVILQNNAFANSEYTAEVLRHLGHEVDLLLWTLKETQIDGGRLRLNSLTGAYSAGNLLYNVGKSNFQYVWGSPSDQEVVKKIEYTVAASKLKKQLRSMTLASIGQTPTGFGFGRGIDVEFLRHFGMKYITVEARELMKRALGYSDTDCEEFLKEAQTKMLNLHEIPDKNVKDFVRLYKAYKEFISENNVSAVASRCWPDFFVEFGTPVCGVLGLLNENFVPASCEADAYGALSMLICMKLSGEHVFFGDPVSLDKSENTLTFWHCGTASCSLAHPSKGAQTGVHPNRKIGPTMEFGCKPSEDATVFRIGRKPDGSTRFFIAKGAVLDKPQQFLGTSLVFKCENQSLDMVRRSVMDGWEPHFVVAYKDITQELKILGAFLKAEICEY